MKRLVATIFGVLIATAASADTIKLLASNAMREIITEIQPEFETASGHTLVITFAGTVRIKELVGTQPFDLVVVGAPEIDTFMMGGKVKPGSRVDLAKSGIGIAVKAGAPKPDIGTADAVKRALLAAKSVAYSTGPSGVYVQKLFEKLGIAAEMKTKSVETVSPRRVGDYIAAGEAELGFQQISELMHEKGIDYLGPLPAEVQNFTLWSSAILATSGHADRARTLQRFLASATADPVIRKNGMEPAR